MKKIAQNTLNSRRSLWGIVILAGVLGLVYAIICFWVKFDTYNNTQMPSIAKIISRFFSQFADLSVLKALGVTLRTLGISLLFAIVLGLLLGFFLGSKTKWAYTQPTVDFLRSIPITFLIPIMAIVFGSSDTINIYLLTIYPTALMIMFGVRTGKQKQDLERLHFFKIIASKQMQPKRYRIEKIKLTLFETIPDIFSGFRIALSYGLVIVTVLEYMHIGVSENSIGIGTLLDRENINHDMMNVFALVLLIGIVGFFLNWITEQIQFKWIHWSNENLKNE
jgi:ABC-type nitrate/sulfonate/bicarbonate transport system permease component